MKAMQPALILVSYHVSICGGGGEHTCEASVKLSVRGRIIFVVSDGNGPVHALDCAIRKALQSLPALKKRLKTMRLQDYKTHGTDTNHKGTASGTLVILTFAQNGTKWTTASKSTNVIEASLNALIQGYQKVLQS